MRFSVFCNWRELSPGLDKCTKFFTPASLAGRYDFLVMRPLIRPNTATIITVLVVILAWFVVWVNQEHGVAAAYRSIFVR
jgi:hypothetical protein